MAWNNAPLFDANAPQVLGYSAMYSAMQIHTYTMGRNFYLTNYSYLVFARYFFNFYKTTVTAKFQK